MRRRAFALVLAVLVSSVAVLLFHKSPVTAFRDMAQFGIRTDSIIYAANAFAYRMVFPWFQQQVGNMMPPPPNAYGSNFGSGMA